MGNATEVTLSGESASWLRAVDEIDGIDTRKLRAGDVLVLETCHSAYTLHLTDPIAGEAQGQGTGNFLSERCPVRLLGISLSGRGSLLKLGFVASGFKAVLRGPDGEILTSRVRRVLLNGMPVEAAGRIH